MSTELPKWRVNLWFLNGNYGWTNIGFAWLKASDREHAVLIAARRAQKIGFMVDNDTKIDCDLEDDSGTL